MILVAVVALVAYALVDTPSSPEVVRLTATAGSIMDELNQVPASSFDQAMTPASGPSSTTTTLPPGVQPAPPFDPPTLLSGEPVLTAEGKPLVLFVGTEYSTFSAAQRWPLVVALARFGQFQLLHNVQSAPNSVFSNVPSFSFVGASYTSPYVTFQGVELYSSTTDAYGVFRRLTALTPAQQLLVQRYRAATGTQPFVDAGNQLVATTSGFSPAILVAQSQEAIAASLTAPQLPLGRSILVAANQLTVGICQATGDRPAAVCSSRGVRLARQELSRRAGP